MGCFAFKIYSNCICNQHTYKPDFCGGGGVIRKMTSLRIQTTTLGYAETIKVLDYIENRYHTSLYIFRKLICLAKRYSDCYPSWLMSFPYLVKITKNGTFYLKLLILCYGSTNVKIILWVCRHWPYLESGTTDFLYLS